MKIIHVINNLERGGSESMLIKLLNNDNVEDNLIYNLIGLNKFKNNNLNSKIINFDFKNKNIFKLLFSIFKFIYLVKKYKPKIMVFWLYHSFILSFFIKLFYFRKIKILWNIRQVVPNFEFEKIFTKVIFKICSLFSWLPDGLIFNSKYSILDHQKNGFNNKKLFFIPNGFEEPSSNIDLFEPRFEEFIKNKYVVSLFARYHPSKGHLIFLKSICQIIENNDEIVFLLAGKNIDTNTEIEKFVKENNLSNKIMNLGEISNINDYLSITDLLVNCSLSSEGFPNILGEAIMSNCICIASDISDNRDLIGEDLIIKKNDHQKLTEKIIEIYKMNDIKKTNIINKLKSRFQAEYSINKVCSIYSKVYKEII